MIKMYREPEDLDKSIKAASDRLEKISKPTCTDCEGGVRMCKHVPCIGTLEEIKILIERGYAKNLMLDWWTGYKSNEKKYNPFEKDIFFLKPAVIGHEGKKSSFFPGGICNLLTSDDKCSVHDFKPIQGRIACCKTSGLNIGKYDERYDILRTWNTNEGEQLIDEWKKLVNYGNNDNDNSSENPVNNLINSLDAIMDIFENGSKT